MRARRTVMGLGLAMACLLGTPASAQKDPPSCNSVGVAIVVQVFRADGTTGVIGSLAPCQSLRYRASLSKPIDSPSICAFEGGTFSLTTPDGVVHPISTNVPCIGGTGVVPSCASGLTSLQSDLIPYDVRAADIVGGLVTAQGSYSGGTAHDSPTGTPGLGANTPKAVPVATTCSDLNVCTADLCDSQLGCVHLPVKHCLVAWPLNISLSSQVGKFGFKRQGGTGDAGDFLKISLQEALLTSENGEVAKKKVKVNAVVTGADAAVGSLLYPVLALGAGNGAAAALQAQGYDVAVSGALAPCTDTLPAATCTALAKQLAQAIDTQLALGDAAEKVAFRQGLEALGYLPDECCVPTTCAAENANCGPLADGCGTTLDCGTCMSPDTCGGGNVPNRCGNNF